MGFFNRNKGPEIPPVAPPPGQQGQQGASDPYARRGGAPAGGDPYASSNKSDPYAAVQKARARGADPLDPYARKQPLGQPGAGDEENDAARNALFGGMTETARQEKPREWGREGVEDEPDFDEDEEVEGIKQAMRETKMETVQSTRNTLNLARQAEDTARGTMGRLADQSERLANSERHLDIGKANSQRAADKADELRKLNRSIFRPQIVWNKDAKRAAQEQKIYDRHEMERQDRAGALSDVQDTRRRLGQAAGAGQGSSGGLQPNKMRDRAEARKKYQFDATASDDELEDEVDENLDEVLDISKRLKGLATGMGEEVNRQNSRITRITDKADNLNVNLRVNTDRLNAIK